MREIGLYLDLLRGKSPRPRYKNWFIIPGFYLRPGFFDPVISSLFFFHGFFRQNSLNYASF